VLGGSVKDIADTALLAVANSVMNEMVVSATVAVLESVAEAHEASVDDAFARYLVGRAEATLTGMAFVGACRSIAWTVSRNRISGVRAEIIELARVEHQRVGGRTGYASLAADDAHTHLWAAQHIVVPDDPEERRRRMDAVRVCAVVGCRLLAMAFAVASGEAWSPFVAHRLSAELEEHAEVLDAVATFSPRDRTDLDVAHQELTNHWSETMSMWRDLVAGGSHDIHAYFRFRTDAPTGLAAPSSTIMALRDGEPGLGRIL
jgi:hypothetical protein